VGNLAVSLISPSVAFAHGVSHCPSPQPLVDAECYLLKNPASSLALEASYLIFLSWVYASVTNNPASSLALEASNLPLWSQYWYYNHDRPTSEDASMPRETNPNTFSFLHIGCFTPLKCPSQ